MNDAVGHLHREHSFDDEEYSPRLQGTQEIAPIDSEIDPGSQLLQLFVPIVDAYVPIPHAVHTLEPDKEENPFAQLLQKLDFFDENWPAWQTVQTEAPKLEMEPRPQSVQLVELIVGLYVPLVHTEQTVLSVPTEYVPFLQAEQDFDFLTAE